MLVVNSFSFRSFEVCVTYQTTFQNIGPQCVLGLLCLLLFLSVRMLFSNVSIWELNYNIFKWEMYDRILFTYLLTLSSNVFSLGPNGTSHNNNLPISPYFVHRPM